jgi:organic hydroperoxide reductase OsmC/OhrA
MGWAGGHTIVVDRPEGKAGGKGLGFNGGQLLALAIGGCFCNDLRYVAHEMGVRIQALSVLVAVDFDGDPLLAVSSRVEISCALADGKDSREMIARAKATSTVSNSLARGFPVTASAR